MYSIKGSKQYNDTWKWSILLLYVGVIIYLAQRNSNYSFREPILYYKELLRFVEHFVLAVFCFRAFATVWKEKLPLRVFVACVLFAVVEGTYISFLGSPLIFFDLLKDLFISFLSIGLGILLARMQVIAGKEKN